MGKDILPHGPAAPLALQKQRRAAQWCKTLANRQQSLGRKTKAWAGTPSTQFTYRTASINPSGAQGARAVLPKQSGPGT